MTEASGLLSEGGWRILAGGTDLYPGLGNRLMREDVLDIGGIAELRGITADPTHHRLGAATRWAEIVADTSLPPAFDALRQAAREVGSVQIQNAATIGGNLCNASPAADGVPCLMALDASVELRSAQGTRRLGLEAFLLGNRRTANRPDELMTAILVPRRAAAGGSAFVKLGARRYLVISIAMAAARLETDTSGRVAAAAVAVGACSAVACRLPALEAALVGRPADTTLAAAVSPAHLDPLAPIDDVRGSAGYRRAAALELVRRALAGALGASPAAREIAA